MKKLFALSCFALLMASACNETVPWDYCNDHYGKFCVGNRLISCNVDALSGMRVVDCGEEGLVCDPASLACVSPQYECTIEDNGCTGGWLQSCDLSTHLLSTVRCPSGTCSDDGLACASICDSGDTLCGTKDGRDVIYSCTADGSWDNADHDNWDYCPLNTHCETEDGIAQCAPDPVCQSGEQRCREENGKAIIDVCNAKGQWEANHPCPTADPYLPYCDDNHVDCRAPRDCAAESLVDFGACTIRDHKSEQSCVACATSGDAALVKCVDGKIEAHITCSVDQVCSTFGDTAGCFDKAESSVVGDACTCEGGQGKCYWVFDGTEMKKLVSNNSHLASLRDAISDDVKIHIPDFFPAASAIQGCDSLKNNLPEGMVLGCMRDETINLSSFMAKDALHRVIDDVVASYMESIPKHKEAQEKCPGIQDACDKTVPEYDETKCHDAIQECLMNNYGISLYRLVDVAKGIVDVFLTDLTFNAPKGYCTAGALNSTVDTTGPLGSRFFKSDATIAQIKKADVGDHSLAVNATCPAGSTKLSYIVNVDTLRVVSTIGSDTEVDFDICLRNCNSDYDCAGIGGGIKCMEMPKQLNTEYDFVNGTVGETAKVCFDKDAYDHLRDLRLKLSLTDKANN